MDNVFIFSIKPKYANQILDGTKTIEFRRRIPRSLNSGDRIIIYSSSPERAIIGVCTVDKIIKEDIRNLWETMGKYSGINDLEFILYYQGVSIGYGLMLREIVRFSSPIRLESLQGYINGFNVPQSCRALKTEEITYLTQEGKL